MGSDEDTLFLQRRNDNGSGGNKGCGDPSAEVSASPVVLVSVVFALCGIVCMTGPCNR